MQQTISVTSAATYKLVELNCAKLYLIVLKFWNMRGFFKPEMFRLKPESADILDRRVQSTQHLEAEN